MYFLLKVVKALQFFTENILVNKTHQERAKMYFKIHVVVFPPIHCRQWLEINFNKFYSGFWYLVILFLSVMKKNYLMCIGSNLHQMSLLDLYPCYLLFCAFRICLNVKYCYCFEYIFVTLENIIIAHERTIPPHITLFVSLSMCANI